MGFLMYFFMHVVSYTVFVSYSVAVENDRP